MGEKGFNTWIWEHSMKLVTAFELTSKTNTELSALQRSYQRALTLSGRSTASRRNALASLENINRERAARLIL